MEENIGDDIGHRRRIMIPTNVRDIIELESSTRVRSREIPYVSSRAVLQNTVQRREGYYDEGR
jgi:hypothetical protein